MRSRIYRGWVDHHRRRPQAHRFRYAVDYLGLDLDEAQALLDGHPWFGFRRPAWLRLHRPDYLGDPGRSLRAAVGDTLRAAGLTDDGGPVQMVTLLRSGGYCFNPVSFYVCRRRDGALRAVIAHITNTPWGERHAYVIPGVAGDQAADDFAKRFHISPFMPDDHRYRWRFTFAEGGLRVRMENHDADGLVFSADLGLRAQPASTAALTRYALRAPLAPLATVARIYWQAWRLWWKRVPFVPHPASLSGAAP